MWQAFVFSLCLACDGPQIFAASGRYVENTIVEQKPAEKNRKLVRSQMVKTERWLVSESWCTYCPAAKEKFLSSGNDSSHIITTAEARTKHSKNIGSIPAEYTTKTSIEIIQPPYYRYQQRMAVTLDGSDRPERNAILKHLRKGGPHQGKHWQRWHLESWVTPQLYALHDDDHNGVVPVFEE